MSELTDNEKIETVNQEIEQLEGDIKKLTQRKSELDRQIARQSFMQEARKDLGLDSQWKQLNALKDELREVSRGIEQNQNEIKAFREYLGRLIDQNTLDQT